MREEVAALNPRTKRAMHLAGEIMGPLRRRTWNNCAFDAAGRAESHTRIRSVVEAAEYFCLPVSIVGEFIHAWDWEFGTDEECTARLLAAIDEVGLDTPSTASDPPAPGRSIPSAKPSHPVPEPRSSPDEETLRRREIAAAEKVVSRALAARPKTMWLPPDWRTSILAPEEALVIATVAARVLTGGSIAGPQRARRQPAIA